MTNKTLEATAYHEAGHAVAHYWLHVPFRYVTIVPDKDGVSLGHIRGREKLDSIHPEYEDGYRIRKWIENRVMISNAGGVAVKDVLGKKVWGLRGDTQDIVTMLSYIAGSDEELYAYSRWLLIRTVDLFKLPPVQAAVHALARELLQRKTIKRREAVDIIQSAIRNSAKGIRHDPGTNHH